MRRGLLLVLLALGACGGEYELPALASTSPPTVRVLLQRRATQCTLVIEGQAWQMVAASGRPFSRRSRARIDLVLRPGARGIAIGPEDTGATVLRIRPERFFALNGTRYPGSLVVHLVSGRIRCVNEIDMETYVAGVIPNEMAPGAPPAAYRAQAVAARTYAWIRIKEAGAQDRVFDLYDDQASQVYTGIDPRYDVPYPRMVTYTRNTSGAILTWQSRPFPAYYASTCGGHTTDPATSQLDAAGAQAPLRGVKCKFCRPSKKFEWAKTVRDEDIVRGMKARRRPITSPVHALRVSKKGAGGWAAEVEITYGAAKKTRKLPGTEFRSALGLDSHHILSMRQEGRTWVIAGRGWGHGVGLCQMGAVGMAERGFSESDILSWYYPGASFTRMY